MTNIKNIYIKRNISNKSIKLNSIKKATLGYKPLACPLIRYRLLVRDVFNVRVINTYFLVCVHINTYVIVYFLILYEYFQYILRCDIFVSKS
jgi:hypothetical protein